MTTDEDQSQKKWLGTLLNAVPTALVVVELGTARIIYANATALKVAVPEATPADIEENAEAFRLYESKWRRGLHDSTGRPIPIDEYPYKRVARGEAFEGYEAYWKLNEGDPWRVFSNDGIILPASHGRPSRGVVVFTDITDRVEQSEKLKEAVAVREEFLSVAAHELKTPITSILLQAQALLQRLQWNNVKNEDIAKRISSIERGANKLHKLVSDLLEISRMTSPAKVKFKETNFCDLVREIIGRFEVLARRHRVLIKLEIPDQPIRGEWNSDKLEHILVNLLSNALKYGNNKPIHVTAEQCNDSVCLCVRDYGIGIAAKDRERIFKRFERAVSSEQYSGMGIGLWIAREAATSMGGQLQVETPPDGVGSLFRLILPIEVTHEQGSTQEASSASH